MKAKVKSYITVALLSILAIPVLSIIINSINGPDHVSALEYTTNYGNSFTLLPSISVSLSSPDLIIDDLLPNTSSDSNEIIINVESNNVSGYILNSSVGSSTNPYNTYGRNLTNTASSSYTFTSLNYGDSKESLTDPNTWGYSYSDQTVETPTWSDYSGLPLYSDTTNIATLKSSNTPSSASGDNIGFKIAAYASNTQGSGEYTNIINFIAVGNPTPISFYDAFADAASQPGSAISQLNGYYKLQDMSSSICSAVDNDEVGQLIDTRDNEVYYVGKLADNRCWMLDNLRLDPTAVDLDTLQGETNASDTTLNYLKNGGGSSPYTGTAVANKTSGFTGYDSPYVNVSYKDDTTTSYGSGSGKVGVYYNYCAASAGSYCYSSRLSSGNASEDICPAGWRMPTGGSSGEYQALYTAYSSNATNFRNALSTPLSGFFYNSSQSYLGSYGNFWSSTRGGNTYMYYLYVDSSSVDPQDGDNRNYGYSVRCVANNE